MPFYPCLWTWLILSPRHKQCLHFLLGVLCSAWALALILCTSGGWSSCCRSFIFSLSAPERKWCLLEMKFSAPACPSGIFILWSKCRLCWSPFDSAPWCLCPEEVLWSLPLEQQVSLVFLMKPRPWQASSGQKLLICRVLSYWNVRGTMIQATWRI